MKAKILIIDDSSLARRLLRQHLEELGHDVIEAPDGDQGLERYLLHAPDLVILDMVMTGMYGIDVLMKMRELNPHVRVIIATADIQSSTANDVKAAGACGILNKPLKREQIAQAVTTVLAGGNLWN